MEFGLESPGGVRGRQRSAATQQARGRVLPRVLGRSYPVRRFQDATPDPGAEEFGGVDADLGGDWEEGGGRGTHLRL